MPTYQYKRKDGTTFEILQRITDDPLKTCPETGQDVERIVTGGGGVIYKGSGWYVTDYKNKSTGGSSSSPPVSSGTNSGDSAGSGNGSGSTAGEKNGNGTASSAKGGESNGSNGTAKSVSDKN